MPRVRPRKTSGVRAVDRAIEILQAFSTDKASMSVLEIQDRVRLSRPTLYRLLETLASRGLIRTYGTPQRFSLDYGVGQLAHNWMSGLDEVSAARPILERLHEDTGETVALFVVRERQHLCVLELPSPHVLSMSRGIGPMGPMARGASGKAILAFMDDDAANAVLRSLPEDIDRDVLRQDLAQVRKDKFRISRGEIFVGAIAIAAPYFDHTNRVAGSIGVFGPEARLSKEWVAETTRRVVASTTELSAALGHGHFAEAKPKTTAPTGAPTPNRRKTRPARGAVAGG
jgi:IclR family transcriptional regulator, acetate operon repressor